MMGGGQGGTASGSPAAGLFGSPGLFSGLFGGGMGGGGQSQGYGGGMMGAFGQPQGYGGWQGGMPYQPQASQPSSLVQQQMAALQSQFPQWGQITAAGQSQPSPISFPSTSYTAPTPVVPQPVAAANGSDLAGGNGLMSQFFNTGFGRGTAVPGFATQSPDNPGFSPGAASGQDGMGGFG